MMLCLPLMQKCCRDWTQGLRLLWLWKLCMLYISVATDQTMPSLRWTYCLSMFQIRGISPQYLYTCMFLASKLLIVIEGLWENLVILLPFLEYTVILDNALLLNNICILNFKKCYHLIIRILFVTNTPDLMKKYITVGLDNGISNKHLVLF